MPASFSKKALSVSEFCKEHQTGVPVLSEQEPRFRLPKKSVCGGLFRRKLKKWFRPGAQAPRPVPEGSAGPMVLSPMDFCIPFIGSLVHLLGCNSMLFSANCSSCFLAVEHTGHCQASLRPASSEPSCCQAFHHPFSAASTFMTALRQGAGSPAGLPGEWGSNGRKIANWPSVRVKSNPTTFLQGIRSP